MFDFEVQYRSGRTNQNADALSRQNAIVREGDNNWSPGLVIPELLRRAVQLEPIGMIQSGAVQALPSRSGADISALQEADPNIEQVWSLWQQRCQLAKAAPLIARSFMGHLLASRPNEIVAMDFTVLEPSRSGQENVLVLTDVFSKFTVAIPTIDQRAETVARVLVEEWFFKFGVLGRIHSDQGRNFEAVLIQQLCRLYQVTKSRSTPYHPAGNGQCERFNCTLHNFLRTLHPGRKRDWESCFSQVLFCYNTTPHQATGESPLI